jgi:hypothetical protein
MKCPRCKTKILEVKEGDAQPNPNRNINEVWVCSYCGYSMDAFKFYSERLNQMSVGGKQT